MTEWSYVLADKVEFLKDFFQKNKKDVGMGE